MATDAELYSGLWEQYQDLAAGMRAIREAVEQAFGATLPPTATLNDELEIITRTIHIIGNRPSPAPLGHINTVFEMMHDGGNRRKRGRR
jgi:hypothetical protein